MPKFKYDCVCQVCGGPGVSQSPGWFGVHLDPRTCNLYLARRNAELERKLREREEATDVVPVLTAAPE